MRKDFRFIIIFVAVIVFTAGFTLYYIGHIAKPLTLVREEVFIHFDGRTQFVTTVYYFENNLPMNVSALMDYPFPDAENLGDAIVTGIYIGTPDAHRNVNYDYTGKNNIDMAVNIPPYTDTQLSITYHRLVTDDRLVIRIMSAGSWGPAKKTGVVYLNLPEGSGINPLSSEWKSSDLPDWDLMKTLPEKPAYESMGINVAPLG